MDAEAPPPATVLVDASELCLDLESIDWLARLALRAHREGARIVLRNASEELAGLIELAGLRDVLRDG